MTRWEIIKDTALVFIRTVGPILIFFLLLGMIDECEGQTIEEQIRTLKDEVESLEYDTKGVPFDTVVNKKTLRALNESSSLKPHYDGTFRAVDISVSYRDMEEDEPIRFEGLGREFLILILCIGLLFIIFMTWVFKRARDINRRDRWV